MNSEFKQRPLRTMNAELQKAGRLLSRISPDRASCLDAVTKCQAFITWLKGTITGSTFFPYDLYTSSLIHLVHCFIRWLKLKSLQFIWSKFVNKVYSTNVFLYNIFILDFVLLGPQELKVLVDLAIISAGETAMETARITCLHTSCLGFAPLIFDLKPSFGFDELMITCEPVWSAVDGDPTLPTKLVGLVIV